MATDTLPVPDAARRLATAYSTLMRGLLFPGSEGDSPYEPFHVGFAPGTGTITPAAFREASDLAEWWDIHVDPIGTWFKDQTVGDPDPQTAATYQLLREAMRATLAGPLHRASVAHTDGGTFHKTRRYVFGRVPGGGLAGLVAFSVET